MPRRKASGVNVSFGSWPCPWAHAGTGSAPMAARIRRRLGTERTLGAVVQHLGRALDGGPMSRERRLVEVALRRRIGVEIAVAVAAAHQHRRIARLELADMGRDVANGVADAP